MILIVTDDQSIDSLPRTRPAMPYLQGRLSDPGDSWVRFSQAFANTPTCCPSRASILTGLYAHHTEVVGNLSGPRFDEASTLATWLDGAGYRTGIFGKYLNGWPFNADYSQPHGWDEAAIFAEAPYRYNDYTLAENGTLVHYGTDPSEYSTDVLGAKAVDFIAATPPGESFFVYFAPNAPHYPINPAARHAGIFANEPANRPPNFNEDDVSDKPQWLRTMRRFSYAQAKDLDNRRRRQYETLLAVDEAIEDLVAAVEARGALGRTLIIVLSDNGLFFGEHRQKGKYAVYEESIHLAFAIRYPGAVNRTEARLVSNVDVAPTVLAATGVPPGVAMDGSSLVPLLLNTATSWRSAVLVEKRAGPEESAADVEKRIPRYWAVRTKAFVYAELDTGEIELYDLTGALGTPDPFQLQNRCPGTVSVPSCVNAAYASKRKQLAIILNNLRTSAPRA